MTGKMLKIVAILTMVTDHVAASIILMLIRNQGRYELAEIYSVLRNIGRIAFPLYIFLLVEGFVYTKNLKKYIASVMIFALLSELPFDLALGKGQVVNWNSQNVYITLTLGLLCLTCIKYVSGHFLIGDMRRYLLYTIVTAIFAGTAFLVRCDYKWGGILAIVLVYMVYTCCSGRTPQWLLYLMMGIICCMTLLVYNDKEGYAFVALLPIVFYNGKRGYIKYKYLYYAVYPVHLLILGVLMRIYGIV